MIILVLFAFLAGIVTILSPCILPILPIILSNTTNQDSKYPWGVVIGFVASFTFFTLFLTLIVRATGVSPDVLRLASVVILIGFGLTLVVPKLQEIFERMFSALTSLAPSQSHSTSLMGGVLVGFSLGLLWTPCVGPILASVISLALTGSVTRSALLITLAYSLGTALPMLMVMRGGQELLRRHQWLLSHTRHIQRVFGVIMIMTALAISFNLDRQFQTYVLNAFPGYGVGLTKFEENEIIKQQLDKLGGYDEDMIGRPSDEMLSDLGVAPKIASAGEWLNSEPLQLAELRGKVVLIDFWTYSCINCIRTLPYLKSWHQKYADQGLVIIGVHTPEFEFEKDIDNLKTAVADFGLEYAIVQDNDFLTWRAYHNQYWPAKYLIDKSGHIRYTHFGEGSYDQTEQNIQKLLAETGADVSSISIDNPEYQTYSRTPETYLGYQRMQSLASPEELVPDQTIEFTTPKTLPANSFAFYGNWLVGAERSVAREGGVLSQSFYAKDVYIVMRSSAGPQRVRVFLDGQPADSEENVAGDDVEAGIVTVDKDRLYHLIKLQDPDKHLLQLEFLDGQTEVFAFTFG